MARNAASRPRKSPLQSSIIRFVDRASLTGLALTFSAVVVAAAFAVYLLARSGHGIVSGRDPAAPITLMDALYFSVVTVSSLGYGDFTPTGVGRFVAMAEAVLGLILVALLVAKLSSERANTLVRLIYANDVEDRLRDYRARLAEMQVHLASCTTSYLPPDIVATIAERAKRSVVSIANYVGFHTNHGLLLELGAPSAIRAVVRGLLQVSEAALNAAMSAGVRPPQASVLVSVARRSSHVIRSYASTTGEEKALVWADVLDERLSAYAKRASTASRKHPLVITPELLARVRAVLPPQPWPKHVHKRVASQLGISNGAALSAIDKLKEQHEPLN